MPARMAMIAMTTNSSINVNAQRRKTYRVGPEVYHRAPVVIGKFRANCNPRERLVKPVGDGLSSSPHEPSGRTVRLACPSICVHQKQDRRDALSCGVHDYDAWAKRRDALHQPTMRRQLFSGAGTSKVRQVLACASPLALLGRARPKRQRTAAAQDAVATTNAPVRAPHCGGSHRYA